MSLICVHPASRYEEAEFESDNLETCPICGEAFDLDDEANIYNNDYCENHSQEEIMEFEEEAL